MVSTNQYRRSSYAALALSITGACAPTLSSQVSDVRSLARVQQVPMLREGQVEGGSSADVRTLIEQPLDANSAVRVALLNNRELRAQLRELGIVSGQLLTAGLIANPTFEVELLPERDSKYELRVEYDVTSLIMAPLLRSAATYDLEAARLSAAGAVVQLGYDVRTRFYALQGAEQSLRFAQQSLDALAAARDAAQALVEAGNIAQLDASSQIAAYERARVSVAKMELEVAEHREEVQRALGLHGEQTAWRIESTLASVPEELTVADDIERQALEQNLDLRAAHKRLEGLARQSGVVRTRAWLPEVAADVHVLRTKSEDAGDDDQWRWGGGVSVQVPLFDRGQGRLRGVEARFDAAMERYQGLAVNLRSAARDARNRLVSSHARAKQYQAVILPAQRAVMEQTLLQYNAMQVGVFQLLEARRELLDVELDYVGTLREYWTSIAEIEALSQGRMVRAAETTQSTTLGAAAGAQGGH